MALQDDGDIVKGLGFVSMYAAWVEEDVEDVLRLLHSVEPYDDEKQRWPISRKLKHAASLVERLKSDELADLPKALRYGVDLFERRNEFIHGRIYAGHDKKEYLRSGRDAKTIRNITSAELYELANTFWEYRGNLIGPQLFRLPRAIAKYQNGAS